jgi:hypothetical protein
MMMQVLLFLWENDIYLREYSKLMLLSAINTEKEEVFQFAIEDQIVVS